MFKKIVFVISLVVTIFVFACSEQVDISKYSFVDSTGKVISLQTKPQRVAVLFSSYADIWNIAGGTVTVTVQESVDRGFCKANDVILVDSSSGHFSIDIELIIASGVDFVIGTSDYDVQVKTCHALNELGIPSALFKVESFEDYLYMLKICTDITSNNESYMQNGVLLESEINEIKRNIRQNDKPKVLFLRAGSSAKSTKAKNSNDNFVCKMLKELGAINIADEALELADTLSLEYIILNNPDYIFITTMGNEAAAKRYIESLFKMAGWKDLNAILNHNYVFLDKNLFHYKPNNKWNEAYRILFEYLY